MIDHKPLFFAAMALFTGPLFGQSEPALRAFFEGKTVRVKMDLPATKDGVDVNFRSIPPVDFKAYSQRIKNAGVSVRNGDTIMVTQVRVKGRNIEFQMGGGGYGTFGDDSGSVSLPVITKSRRESDLERMVSEEGDRRRRESLERELSRIRADRQRAEERRRVEEARLREMRRMEIMEKARMAGSRFNIWYPNNYLKESIPTPRELMETLDEFVDFKPIAGQPQRPMMTEPPPPPAQSQLQFTPRSDDKLKRGMSRAQVYEILGQPTEFKDTNEGQLQIRTERFLTATEAIEVDFLEGITIRYRTTSR